MCTTDIESHTLRFRGRRVPYFCVGGACAQSEFAVKGVLNINHLVLSVIPGFGYYDRIVIGAVESDGNTLVARGPLSSATGN